MPIGYSTQRDSPRIVLALGLGLALVISLLPRPTEAGAPGPEDVYFEEATITDAAANTLASEEPSGANPAPLPIAPVPAPPRSAPAPPPAPRPVLDPSARLVNGSKASESWALYIDLESGHRITQRFLLSNSGPGNHNGVALGHLVEPGRAPYRYQNGRTRKNWTLSKDRLFFDISASHLDLHRPKGELRITKDELEIRLFFDFPADAPSARVPKEHLPSGYNVEVLAIAAKTEGSIRAPWMTVPVETRGRAWLVHSWTKKNEADLLFRRVDVFGYESGTSVYGIHLKGYRDWESGWSVIADAKRGVIESGINLKKPWIEIPKSSSERRSKAYPAPKGFEMRPDPSQNRLPEGISGPITLGSEWLRFDPLEVIPQPFRMFIRSSSQPQEVWATTSIGVRLSNTPGTPSLPEPGETVSTMAESRTPTETRTSSSQREIEEETADRSVTGVSSITYMNPTGRR